MKNFSDLKSGDTIWVVYNKNYKDWSYENPYTIEYIIKSATVKRNTTVIREISSDYYNNDNSEIILHDIEIEIKSSLQRYKRNYDNFYNNTSHITMSSCNNFYEPTIDVFINKKDALKYIEELNNCRISLLEQEIKNRQNQLELCKQSIINAYKYNE